MSEVDVSVVNVSGVDVSGIEVSVVEVGVVLMSVLSIDTYIEKESIIQLTHHKAKPPLVYRFYHKLYIFHHLQHPKQSQSLLQPLV